jgi:hypothetical protein
MLFSSKCRLKMVGQLDFTMLPLPIVLAASFYTSINNTKSKRGLQTLENAAKKYAKCFQYGNQLLAPSFEEKIHSFVRFLFKPTIHPMQIPSVDAICSLPYSI